MFERILVPLDGSASAERILSYLPIVCAGRLCQVTLARIVDSPPAAPAPEESLLPLARTYLERLASGHSGPSIHPLPAARAGPVADSLLALAREEHASLFLASTFGDRRSGRTSPGPVISRLIARSPIPLLLANPLAPFATEQALRRLKSRGIGRVLVVADPGDPPEAALLPASEFAAAFGLDVVLLRVVPPAPTGRGEAERRSTAEDFLGRSGRMLEERRATVAERLVEEGDPAERIVDVARRKEAALIALSGRDGSRLLPGGMGPVTREVLERVPVPVLLPPAPGAVPAHAGGDAGRNNSGAQEASPS